MHMLFTGIFGVGIGKFYDTQDDAMSMEMHPSDAPEYLDAFEANAWADGYNACIAALRAAPARCDAQSGTAEICDKSLTREVVDITGWKLVPDDPTEAMWQAGRSADIYPGDSYSKVWRAMFDAAPDVDDCETTSSISSAEGKSP